MKSRYRNNGFARLLAFQITAITVKNLLVCNNVPISNYNTLLNLLVLFMVFVCVVIELFRQKLVINLSPISVIICAYIYFFWIVSLLIHPNMFSYEQVRNDFVDFFAYSCLALLMIPSLDEPEVILEYFYKYSYLMFGASLLSVYFFYSGGEHSIVDNNPYSMIFGAHAVLPCLLLLSSYKVKRHWWDLLFACILVFFILTIASRFPLLYIVAYVFFSIFLYLDVHSKLICILLGTLGGIVFWFNRTIFLKGIWIVLTRFGIGGRTVDLLGDGVLFRDGGRSKIHEELIEGLNKVPLTGNGAGGDVLILNGNTAHGFFYSCLANLGYIVGGLFILITFYIIIRCIFRNYKSEYGELMLIFACCFFPTVILQDSLWEGYKFWWLLALALHKAIRNNKHGRCLDEK